MLSFKQALQLLEDSEVFKSWRRVHPEAFLSHGFFMVAEQDDSWRIGFYHSKDDKITSFSVGKKVCIESSDDVFKKPKTKVVPLDLDKVKLDLAEAVAVATDLQREEFASELPTKIICVLQNLKDSQVWNITFLTQSFNTLNFKIKSENGRVLEKKLQSIVEFKK